MAARWISLHPLINIPVLLMQADAVFKYRATAPIISNEECRMLAVKITVFFVVLIMWCKKIWTSLWPLARLDWASGLEMGTGVGVGQQDGGNGSGHMHRTAADCKTVSAPRSPPGDKRADGLCFCPFRCRIIQRLQISASLSFSWFKLAKLLPQSASFIGLDLSKQKQRQMDTWKRVSKQLEDDCLNLPSIFKQTSIHTYYTYT